MASASLPGRSAQIRFVSLWGKALIVLTIVASASALVFGFEKALVALTGIAFVAAVAGLRWRAVGLLGIGMLCALDGVTRFVLFTGGALRFNTLNYWLLIVIALNLQAVLRWRDSQSRLLFVLILVLAFGLIWSPGRWNGMQHILNLVSLLGILVYMRRAGNDREAWFWFGGLTGCVGACVGALVYLQRGPSESLNMNAWAYVPLTGLFGICLAMAAGAPRRSRAAVLALLAVANAMWVLLSGSRNGILVALLCGVFLFVTMRGFRLRMVVLLAAGLAAVVMGTWFRDEALFTLDRFQRLFDSSVSASKRTNGHLDLAVGGWYVFVDHPFGVGTGGFAPTWARLGPREKVSTFRYGREMQAHSVWVKALAENGMPGLLCLAAFVLSFVLVGLRRGRAAAFRLGAFVTVALATAFLATEFATKGPLMLAAGATALLTGHEARRLRGATQKADREARLPTLSTRRGRYSSGHVARISASGGTVARRNDPVG